MEGQAYRESGRRIIEEKIKRLRRQADNLEKILEMIPQQPTKEEDESIWEVFVNFPQS